MANPSCGRAASRYPAPASSGNPSMTYAVDNNLLIEYDKTCRCLAAINDIDTLTEYVTTLHNCFGHQDRWSIFDRNICMAVGRWAWTLRERGVLDPN